MKLICEGTMLAIVPWAYLHCVFCGDPRFEIGVPEFLRCDRYVLF